jgi:hypothetical protein
MKRAILVTAAALLALAACSKKTETAATGTTAPATAAATVTAEAAPAAPAAPPSRKAGLWEQKISTDKMSQTMKMCLDAAADQKMKWWGSQAPSGKSGCAQQSVTPHLGGGWDFHAVCAMGESGTITSDGSATGDFSSHYKVEVTSVTSGSPIAQANGPHKTSIEATWTGPCPADMKPGDMELPGGMRINTLEPNAAHTPADIAKLRAQAMAMAKAAKAQQEP